MNDTIKLIVEIHRWYYKELNEFLHPTFIDMAIKNGIPLDKEGRNMNNTLEEKINKLDHQINDMLVDLASENEELCDRIASLKNDIQQCIEQIDHEVDEIERDYEEQHYAPIPALLLGRLKAYKECREMFEGLLEEEI